MKIIKKWWVILIPTAVFWGGWYVLWHADPITTWWGIPSAITVVAAFIISLAYVVSYVVDYKP